ncbi:LysR family transcriptional regulator [Rhizobium sp. PL01]|uniref:LysR family transcriptional regulator n=1 Tax=Rhizobium sp. PL01 TaxID=3085631 RepID=UPI00298103D3|nr:LysR family transcriptional regulator [Rhizobium sp. PL01]MDW5318185.1 LysR family transcriptional regulator [Rhizobium sp. PL01]
MPDLTLDLRYLRYALMAAEHHSFRRAAAVLEVPQSTVSRRIQLLEHRLGFLIFERGPRGATLTAAGETFLHHAATGVNHFDRAVQIAISTHRGESGDLHIGILGSLTSGFLHQILRQYRAKHADVRVSLHEGTTQENFHRLATGSLDVIFVTGDPVLPGYRSAKLGSECVFVALPSSHPLAVRNEVTWEEIRDENFIVSTGGPGPEIRDYLIKRLAAFGFSPKIDPQEVGRESVMNLVAIGYGLTLASTSALGAEIVGVVFRPIAGNDDILTCSAVWSSSNINTALKCLLAVAKAVAREFKPSRDKSAAAIPVIHLLIPIGCFARAPMDLFAQIMG